MNDKMKRFLTSIGINNLESFDLDFDLVTRNPFKREQVDMLVVKDTPWDYEYLEQLQHALETVTYPIDIKFSYKKKPTVEDAIRLFPDWHRSHNRFVSEQVLENKDGQILFVFKTDEDLKKNRQIMDDFKEFLKFLSYRFDVISEVREEEKTTPNVSQKVLEKMEEKANEVYEEENAERGDEEDDSYYKNAEMVEEEEEETALKAYEEQYIEALKDNISRLKDLGKNTKINKTNSDYDPQSWRDSIPFKKYTDFSLIKEDSGNVDITGEVFGIDKIRTNFFGKAVCPCGLGNGTQAINIRIVENKHTSVEDIEKLKNSMYIHIKGYAEADKRSGQVSVTARGFEIVPPPAMRSDDEEQKRVELHLHTRMSVMDGVTSITDYCKLAKAMGHKAVAVTDHGVVQSFPEAQNAQKETGVKILYGSELYMVNDELPFALNPQPIPLRNTAYVVFDLETTGLSKEYDRITEFGAIRFEHGNIVKTEDFFINPTIPIPQKVQDKTHITQAMVNNAPKFEECADRIIDFFKDAIIVSHNITFDLGFINASLIRMGREPINPPAIDTLSLSHYMFPEAGSHRLGSLSRNLGIQSYNDEEAHRADYDAKVLNEVWLAMLNRLTEHNMDLKHSDLAEIKTTEAMLKHIRPSHINCLVKDEDGFRALYELVSLSHIKYLADVPKTPKREISRLREHLLLGSACCNGEVFDAARTMTKADLKEVMKFYDFIEVQPPENYRHLVNLGSIDSFDEVKKYIKDIVECADEIGKPVVATGDVHYLNPEDKITRDVYISAKAVGGKLHPLHMRDTSLQAPDQHYRSTKEMLDAFSFLGKEKAFEIVVTNTNKIADSIGEFNPIKKDLHPPIIEEAPQVLRDTCYAKAHEIYGDPLPEEIQTRLERELSGIIDNGYSVTYYIAHEIVRRANEAGFVVGSRGSVGSSFAAHMFGITEVNPLRPHYHCPKCKHLEWIDDPNIHSGYDLPDKKCPICGEKMVGDGQNIPFETFLGFNADKIPDIDLNFPSDYQKIAFNSTKDIFGPNNVFRAGTIETVAEKTAFGYVRGYFEERGVDPSTIPSSYIAYLASHVADTKRTTGQHPGGIMVLPKSCNIYDFTPIQYPADDKESDWLTTHLDYTALHDALLKLDLLGHVDPLALRLMTEMTGVNMKDIPLNDKKVISLFTTDKALERSGNYLKVKNGASGLPEFGTDVCRDILLGAQPKSFADLVVVAGLAHGTDVWQGNASELIKNGTCTIREVIGCRDDIMTYLIKKGVQPKTAFNTMESVRKGRKIPKEAEEALRACNVPEWYIDSCNKIKYMFPKAHAVAYVTMAVRVGYFKLYYPLEFYAVWFSARCKQYDIEPMLGGKEAIIQRYDELKGRKNKHEKLSPKETDILKMLTVAIEMTERGYKFEKVDLYKSKATEFVVDHENKSLICPFIVIDGLGENAAISVVEAREKGPFSSKEDLLKRTKLSSTNVEDLSKIGTLDGMGDSDQMSLFEFGLDL